MRSVALITAVLVLCASSSAFAQIRQPARNAPTARTTSPAMTSPMTAPGTIPATGGSPGAALGAIQPMIGTSATIARGAIGTVTDCPTTGTAASSTPFNATFADPLTGALPTQPLPGATLPPAYAFGSSISTGACDPTASATATLEALGASVSVTLPGPATITGSTYSDATIPPTATEAGAAGLSPLIVVPTPINPSASPDPATDGSMFSGNPVPSP